MSGATTKTHHNVGGMLGLLVAPPRELFKAELIHKAVGAQLTCLYVGQTR